MDRWRTSICTAAKNTKDKIAFLEAKEARTLETMRMADIRNMRKNIGNQLMLDGLEMEAAKSWPTLANLTTKIEADVIIPQTILNYGEYQAKLQRLAMFAELGDREAMQAVLDNQVVLEKKNRLLQPLFRDMKSQIRHMSFTPEYEMLREYVHKRRQIETSVKGQASEAWKEKSCEQLRELYAILLAKRQQKIRGSLSLRVKTLQKRLENIFELLSLWNQYVEVVYMPEGEVHMVDQLSSMEGRLDDLSYVQLMEKDETAKRMKMLFKPDDAEGAADQGEFDAAEALNEAYETVNEGDTTDTTSGLDGDALLSRNDPDAETKKRQVSNVKSTKTKTAPAVEEGIKSSDDDEVDEPKEEASSQPEAHVDQDTT